MEKALTRREPIRLSYRDGQVMVTPEDQDIFFISAERATEATGGSGVDIALDHVGGQLFAELLPATRLGGMIVNIGRLAGPECTINLDQLSFRRLRVRGTTFSVRTPEERAEVCAALVPDVLPAVADGRIQAMIDRVVPFDEALSAAQCMRANEAAGKIVLELP